MESMELLYDHYKETFNMSKEAQNRRNKYFVILCILEALSFLFITNPEKVMELINKGVESKLEVTVSLGLTIIQTLLWLLIVYTLIRYIQDMLYVERQYKYLEMIEKEIDSLIGEKKIFCREGQNYLENYPMVLNFIDLFYKMLIPILFLAINVVRIIAEWKVAEGINIALVCDTILFVSIFVITWFYFFEIHSKITEFAKKYIPGINKIANFIRKLLKEV